MNYEIQTTSNFDKWLKNLTDRKAALAILQRINRAKIGLFGDVKAVGDGVIEMRVFVGQGYRVYFTIRDAEIILLLCGGNKSSQQRDIEKAKNLRNQL